MTGAEFPRDFPIDWEYEGTKYVVRLEIQQLHGRIEPVGIAVKQKYGSEPRLLTSRVLRAVPVARLMSEVLARIRTFNELAAMGWSDVPWLNEEQPDEEFRVKAADFWKEAQKAAPAVNDLLVATGQGHGRRWGPEHYRQVLAICATADLLGQSRTKAVALAFGLKRDTAAKHIERANKIDNADAPAPATKKGGDS